MSQLQVKLQDYETLLENSTRTIDNELPISGWLQKFLEETLSPCGFVANSQAKAVAPVNEYVRSKGDITIYHSEKFVSNRSALHLEVQHANHDDNEMDEVDLKGFVTEVKVKKTTDSTENECFYNMFGQAINLAMKEICGGHLVQLINMYGIVVGIQEPNKARPLHLIINFQSNQC